MTYDYSPFIKLKINDKRIIIGSRLRFEPEDYNLDEIGGPIPLVIMAFKYYFDAARINK
ncbi:MAG: hypothetical protein ACFE8G_06505 [Candidatus Hermodarchaeota archaeon]